MVEIRKLDSSSSSDRQLLDGICKSNGRATAYHSKEWLDVQEQVFHYRTFYMLATSADRYCLLPLSGVRGIPTASRLACLPLTQFCEPLFNDDELLEHTIKYAIALTQQERYRALVLKPRHALPSSTEGLLGMKEYYRDYTIDLRFAKPEAIWNKLNKSERNSIRKAERLSVEVEDLTGERDMNELNSVMLKTTRRHSVPAYPLPLLHFIHGKMKTLARIYVAKYNGRIVAGIVVFTSGKSSILGYSFALQENLVTGSAPLLLWNAIRDSINDSKESFDLGIASPEDTSLAQFKARFAAFPETLPFYFEGARFEQLVFDPNSSFKFISRAWNALPLVIHSKIGPLLVTRFG